jgi:hypothetical protein
MKDILGMLLLGAAVLAIQSAFIIGTIAAGAWVILKLIKNAAL